MTFRQLLTLSLSTAIVVLPTVVFAQAPQGYVPLVRIPGISDADFTNATSIVNGLIRIVIVAAGLLAVIQIVRGGFLYITTEAVSTKGEARKLISDALTGLLLILGSILILTYINPDILKLRLFNDPRPANETLRQNQQQPGNTLFSNTPNNPNTGLVSETIQRQPNTSRDGFIIREYNSSGSCPSRIKNGGYDFSLNGQPQVSGTTKKCSYIQI